MSKTILIIGAGPAGLSAAYILSKASHKVYVYESHPHQVGGLSKTVHHNGFSFDIGGHRFFTKAPEVEQFWHSVLKEDFIKRKRLSRIYYNRKFLKYPLELNDLISKIPLTKSIHFFFSYLYTKMKPIKTVKSFEDWVISQFGESLYLAFFKSYTEKVWGMPCKDISKDWAAQRINNLNLFELLMGFIKKALGVNRKSGQIKSLIEEFDYPKLGPGMLWDKVRREIEEMGGIVQTDKKVSEIIYEGQKWHLVFSDKSQSPSAEDVINSAPLTTLLSGLSPQPPSSLLSEIKNYKYRDFLTVVLMFKKKDTFPDNWIYIHDPRVKVARIQNYKNWSPAMVPSDEYSSYGLEYFCQRDDHFWKMSDEELLKLAIKEVQTIGLPFSSEELDFKVVRMPFAYPVYDHQHSERSQLLQTEMQKYPGLHFVGRNGLHRYNNQDHSIKTAMIVAENIIQGSNNKSPWNVNQDAEYLEKDS